MGRNKRKIHYVHRIKIAIFGRHGVIIITYREYVKARAGRRSRRHMSDDLKLPLL